MLKLIYYYVFIQDGSNFFSVVKWYLLQNRLVSLKERINFTTKVSVAFYDIISLLQHFFKLQKFVYIRQRFLGKLIMIQNYANSPSLVLIDFKNPLKSSVYDYCLTCRNVIVALVWSKSFFQRIIIINIIIGNYLDF